MDTDLLQKYARLVVRVGVNLQHDQLLVINAPLEAAEFARALSREAFAAGAHDVVVSWSDEQLAHIRYKQAQEQVFTEFPDWRQAFYTDYAEQGAAFISIAARDPEIFADVDPSRLTLAQQAAGAALLEYRERLMSNRNTWCVVSVPTPAWAQRVFPDDDAATAMKKLWAAILATSRVRADGDPVAEWQEHIAFLHRAASWLNEHHFRSLHYRNSLGTDLKVRLPERHIWAGGAEDTDYGVSFAANIPSEEVYTLPERDGVDGIVYAAKPLIYGGSRIEDFYLRFEHGRVVDYDARVGKPVLTELLSTDEGARYLGEVALVPFDSPISQSGLLFYNTLFDENAACHLALGKAYPTCLRGGADMDSVTLLQQGANDSLIHEDFMVGTRDLEVTGKQADGTEVPVMRAGNFAF